MRQQVRGSRREGGSQVMPLRLIEQMDYWQNMFAYGSNAVIPLHLVLPGLLLWEISDDVKLEHLILTFLIVLWLPN